MTSLAGFIASSCTLLFPPRDPGPAPWECTVIPPGPDPDPSAPCYDTDTLAGAADAFEDGQIDPSADVWTAQGGSVREDCGSLIFQTAGRRGDAAGLTSPLFDMTNRAIIAEIQSVPDPELLHTESWLVVMVPGFDGDFGIYCEDGSLDVDGNRTPYNPNRHRWWRLRFEESTLYADVSPDSVSWVSIGQYSNPGDPAAVMVEAGMDTFGDEHAVPGPFRLDNVNRPRNPCP